MSVCVCVSVYLSARIIAGSASSLVESFGSPLGRHHQDKHTL